MYWPIERAVIELKRRQQNKELVRKINEFLGSECLLPDGRLYGVLARHIASARLEDVEFEKRCLNFGLEPLFAEYTEDLFVSCNPSKTRLIFLYIFHGRGKKGGLHIERVNIVHPSTLPLIDGRVKMSQIKTWWGENLVEFHHRSREMVGLKGKVIEISGWLKGIGQAQEYYKYYLAACVTRGILFESFHSPGFGGSLDAFNQAVVLPAWKWVVQQFGVEPLIVRHPDTSQPEEEKRILNFYPPAVLEAIP